MTIADRKDLKNFKEAKNNSPNRLVKIHFHGTEIVPKDYKHNPGKNEINFASAGSETETIKSP